MTKSNDSSRDRFSDRLVQILDLGLRLPGTNIRFGIDPIIGLIPGVGDAIGAALGSLIILRAASAGAPKRYLAAMLGNLLLDYVVGLVPILGDIFDLTFRANERNLKILREIPADAWGSRRDADAVGRLVAYTVVIVFVAVAAAAGWLVASLLRALAG